MERKFDPLGYRIDTLKDMDQKFGHHVRLNRKLFGRKRVKEIRQSIRGLAEFYGDIDKTFEKGL